MNKKAKKIILSTLVVGTIFSSVTVNSHALITGPAKVEYKTVTVTVTPQQAKAILNDVNVAKKQNTVAKYVKASGTALKLAGYKAPAALTSTVGRMLKSRMNIKNTENFAKKVINSNKKTTGKFKLERYFDGGSRMSPWLYVNIK